MALWCSSCAKYVQRPDHIDGRLCCSMCGRVIEEDNFAEEPSFVKNSSGQSQLAGNLVRVQGEYSASRERILNEAYDGISNITYHLGISGGDSIIRPALAFYTIALERNFTRGRRKELVEAACLYISCREQKRPYLLIDFSEYLRVNVYVLGAVFLQLCKLLSLEEHPIVQKPVDPSLFIDRFTERLLKTRNPKVSRTALRIIASMKRDWMQTGRKPSGLCGAALYISVLSHGLKYSKLDIVHIVHVCEATLTKRLIEFENTESGSLTIEEFNIKADELEKEDRSTTKPSIGSDASEKCELLCEHKGSGISPFAHGLCRSCYDDFMKLSGGLEGGSEPPAFQRAERERALIKESSEMNLDEEENLEGTDDDNLRSKGAEALGSGITNAAFSDNDHDKLHGADDRSPKKGDESDSLSDIDDAEVENYLHTEEEKHYKRIIWENLNREYLEEQAAKEAAEAAAEEAYNSNFSNYPEDVQAAKKLAASTAAAVANLREERKRKRAAEAKNSLPAQTAAEATRQMLTKKRLSSKINYDVLDKLFEEPAAETGKEYNDEKLPPHDSKMDTEHIGDDAEVMDGAYSNYDENTEGHDYDYAHDADFFYDGF